MMSERKKFTRSRRGTPAEGSAAPQPARVQRAPKADAPAAAANPARQPQPQPNAQPAPRRKLVKVQPAHIARKPAAAPAPAQPPARQAASPAPAPEPTPKAKPAASKAAPDQPVRQTPKPAPKAAAPAPAPQKVRPKPQPAAPEAQTDVQAEAPKPQAPARDAKDAERKGRTPAPAPVPAPATPAEHQPAPQAKPAAHPAPRPRRVSPGDTVKPIRPRRPTKPVVLPSSARTDVTPPLILTPEDMPPAAPAGVEEKPLAMPQFKDKSTTPARPTHAPQEAAAPAPAPASRDQQRVPRVKTAKRSDTDVWHRLGTQPLSAAHLERNRIISATRRDPAHTAFDVLRTRLLQALDEKGWTRVAITSPTKDCGKTFIAANLAMSLSRQEACRTLLLDMDLRAPSLARVLGASDPGSMGDFLRGNVPAEEHFLRLGDDGLSIGRNIAVGLNGLPEGYASELLQLPETSDVLDRMHRELNPDVVLYDLPPALFHDDVMAFRPHIDGVLLVIGGGITKASEVKEVERRLGETTPLLGVIMNKAEGPTVSTYSY